MLRQGIEPEDQLNGYPRDLPALANAIQQNLFGVELVEFGHAAPRLQITRHAMKKWPAGPSDKPAGAPLSLLDLRQQGETGDGLGGCA